MIDYSAHGVPITLSGNERFFAKRVMAQEDRFQANYQQTAKARSEAGKAGAEKRWQTMANDSKPKQTESTDGKNANSKSISKSKSISPNGDSIRGCRPTLDEVREYCAERGNRVDPERWYAYYESNGFRVGKNPMKDWKACVRTWERNGYDKPQAKSFADMWREMG